MVLYAAVLKPYSVFHDVSGGGDDYDDGVVVGVGGGGVVMVAAVVANEINDITCERNGIQAQVISHLLVHLDWIPPNTESNDLGK
ncbi:unnamed protein product [Echinostoma caproni]|uniref:Uncharacterized protein n=1 Tax=Echinostoma caproni TaxID=27848 RepID=A0A183AV26_9TREM|nr:unnamed protein product [Echinostoma caproni]